jgi:hypothetical protein
MFYPAQATQGITRFLSSKDAFEEWQPSSIPPAGAAATDVAGLPTAPAADETHRVGKPEKQGVKKQYNGGFHYRALVVGLSGDDRHEHDHVSAAGMI